MPLQSLGVSSRPEKLVVLSIALSMVPKETRCAPHATRRLDPSRARLPAVFSGAAIIESRLVIIKTVTRRQCFIRALAVSFALLLALAGGCSQDALGQNAEVIVRIDVDDRSEDSIDRAAREALESVLLKRSGDRALLTHPSVSAALGTARSNLSLYQFERVENRTRFVAHIDESLIESLIQAANGTLWAEARPPILLWLVVDDLSGRRFGNTEEEKVVWESLSEAFDQLGIKLRRPLYDLSDSVVVSPETLWRRDFGPIVEASERYGMTHLLVGRLIGLSEGRYIGEWVYRDTNIERAVSVQAASTDALIDPGLDMAMEEMRRQYAVALSDRKATEALRVNVRNVVTLEDYRAVTTAMASIQTLVNVRPVAVTGDVLTLELAGIGDAETLVRLMASRSDLVWVLTDPDATEGLVLAWQRP